MTTKFHFQAPGAVAGGLLQTLTDASTSSSSGGGVFAWATASGVRALFENPDFAAFLARASFELVIGTDSITDTKALNALQKAQALYPKLSVKMAVNDTRPLFHPKLAWFISEQKLTLIVGSGNLTRGGLLGNWEAFSVSEMPIEDLADILLSLEDWTETIDPGLLETDDPRVADRVSQNSGDERTVKRASAAPAKVSSKPTDFDGWLIAELNKSRKDSSGRSMFSQASFDGETFASFFNFSGGEVDVVLYPVAGDGSIGELESRKGRYKAASVNYYFELGSVQGQPYPSSGRPTAVFGRLSSGGYVYRVFLPGDPGHSELEAWLKINARAASSVRMRRKIVSTDEVHAAWPANPVLTAETPGS